jgi:hypothetical protein
LFHFYSTWLPPTLILAAVLNIGLTVGWLPHEAWPIRLHENGSLTHLVHTDQPSVDLRYGFYLELADATEGGTLVVPTDSFVVPELAEGFADLAVVEADYDPATPLPDGFDKGEPRGEVAVGEGEIPYWIVGGEGDVWWLVHSDGGVVVVPASVVAVPGESP